MKRILSYPLSLLAYLWFVLFISIFHPIQWICYNIFGYQAHKKSVDGLNFFLVGSLYFIFSSIKVENREFIPKNQPVIFAANHQGLFDIIGFAWFFRKFHPKYVSKIELGKGIPSVSYNLRHGGSVLIDRHDPKQALPMLKKMGEYIQQTHRSVVIYPEGTRSKDGKPGVFASNGLKILCKYAPDAYVVPVTINHSWNVFSKGSFPLTIGTRIIFTVHEPLKVHEYDFKVLFEKTEKAIVEGIIQ